MAIRILTDSSCDISPELAREFNIIVVPMIVRFGDESFRAGVDITTEEFYIRLRESKIIPSTAQPAPGDFVRMIETNADPGDTIVCVMISGKLSGTISSCKLAAGILEDKYKFEFVDSGEVCVSLGLFVLRLAQMIRNGAPIETIMNIIPKIKEQVKLSFTTGTLEFLEKNGRIGKASSYLGSLLNIKPVLEIADGLVSPVEKIRGNMNKVCDGIVARMIEKYNDTPLEVLFVHTDMPDYLEIIKKSAEAKLNIVESRVELVGSLIASHIGPLAVGVAALPMDLR